jgi:hypothetical protein
MANRSLVKIIGVKREWFTAETACEAGVWWRLSFSKENVMWQ